MKTDNRDIMVSLIETVNVECDRDYDATTIAFIGRPDFKGQVPDSPMLFSLRGTPPNNRMVVAVSNPEYPDFVADAVRNTRETHARVSAEVGRRILLPDLTGLYGAQSYAFYPELQPISRNRGIRQVQKLSIEDGIYAWLTELSACSQAPVDSFSRLKNLYLEPLKYVCEEEAFSDRLRSAAAMALDRIKRETFAPMNIIQHGDFWLGNILLNKNWPFRGFRDFRVIDWGAVNQTGYPVLDLLRFAQSSTHNDQKVARYLAIYNLRSKIPTELTLDYVCSGIGWLGLHRNNFPFERYIASSERLFAFAGRLVERLT